MKTGITAFLVLVFSIPACRAQMPQTGSWNILNIKYTLNSKTSIFGEAQLRSLKFYDHFHYYEYKAGVNYKLSKQFKLTLGAGSYQTYREGGNFVLPKNNDEFRIWPQAILMQSFGPLKVEQRYRAEFRFTSSAYRNRFRYRLGLSYMPGKGKNGKSPLSLSASNELFFTDKEPYFERNRVLLALNYKVALSVAFQLGYLYQFDYRIKDETGRNFMVLGIYADLFGKSPLSKNEHAEIKDSQ